MAKAAFRKCLVVMAAAAALTAAPAGAQLYSDGFKFLEAIEDKDGAAATEMLNAPGSTIVNARDISTGRTGLHIVTERRDLTWVGFLLQEGADPNIRDTNGVPPLMIAVRLGFVGGIEALLRGGARVDVADNTGETPLMSAVHSRNTEMMRVLLQAGADPDKRDNSGRSAREYAQLRGPNDIVLQTLERHEQSGEERRASGGSYGPSF